MKKNKILPAIIVVVILIIVLLGGLAYAYFFTDAFKSDKQLFFKYVSENFEIVKNLKDEDLEKYKEKQQNTPYTSDGEIKMYFTLSGTQESNLINTLKNCNITFNGSTDKANKYAYQKVNLNYSDSENLSFEYIHNQDTYGIKINEVLNKFIAVENNNLKEWARTLGLDEETIELILDKFDFENNIFKDLFTEEEIKTLQDKYLNLIVENLTDEMFSKGENAESTIYTITITKSQAENIGINLLQTLKDDELIFSKMKKVMTENLNITETDSNSYIQEIKDKIQDAIDEISNSSSNMVDQDDMTDTEGIDNTTNTAESRNLVVNVYVKNKSLQKTEFVIDENKMSIIRTANGLTSEYLKSGEVNPQTIAIEKTKSSDELSYNLQVNEDGEELKASASFKGISTLNAVEESYEYTINSTLADLAGKTGILTKNYEYAEDSENDNNQLYEEAEITNKYKNTKTFNSNLTKENITTDEMMLLNNHSIESIGNLFSQVGTRFEQVNSAHISSIGLSEDENPFEYYLPATLPLAFVAFANSVDSSLATGIYSATIPVIGLGVIIYNNATSTIPDASLSDAQIQNFNSKFTPYAGENVSGSSVNALIQSVISSNASEAMNVSPKYVAITFPDASGVEQEISGENSYLNPDASNEVNTDKYYNVELEYDSDGYVNKIIVQEN